MNDAKFPTKEINAEIERWQVRLGLQDWSVTWYIGGQNSASVTEQCAARIYYRVKGRAANIEFSPFYFKGWRSSLKHEMLHLLLVDLADMAEKTDADMSQRLEHMIIRKLERLIK